MNQGIPTLVLFLFPSILESFKENKGFPSSKFNISNIKAIPTKSKTRINLKIVDISTTESFTNLAEAITCPIDCTVPPIKAEVNKVSEE